MTDSSPEPVHMTPNRTTPALVLIETRSPRESADVTDFIGLAAPLLDAGMRVQLHFIQNAVFWLQCEPERLRTLQQQGGKQLQLSFDDFSLDQRAIAHATAAQFGSVQTMDALIATLADRVVKTIWHS